YPTLLMYVNAPFQAWQSEPSFLTARIVAIVLAVASVAATWWLGRRAYGPHAGAVAAAAAAVCTVHVAYSREAVTDIPLALGVAASLALMVSGRIELAGAAGLARFRARPCGADRVRRPTVARVRACLDHRGGRARFCPRPPVAHGSRPRVIRPRLLRGSAHAARPLRPLRPAARSAARSSRRAVPRSDAGYAP